jgi:hypothetical protein
MRLPLALAGLAALVAAFATPAWAILSERTLGPDELWVVLASRQDPAEAIALARTYAPRFEAVHVATSANGWHAVYGGPVAVGDAARTTAALRAEPGLPDDLFLADGARFEAPFYSLDAPRRETLRYQGDAPLSLPVDGATLFLSSRRDAYDLFYPVIEGRSDGRALFAMDMSDAASFSRGAWVTIAPLDPHTPEVRQIVAAAFTGGAHCCALTKIAAPVGDGWAVIPGAMLDGDRGYAVEDLDGDGIYELASVDQSFLYAYAPYAFSYAPLVIERFAGKKIVEVTDDPRFRPALARDLAALEAAAEATPGLWNENGFLAAWVAAKARLGQLDEAWARMLSLHDRSSDWPLTICAADPAPDGSCPPGAERSATFPEALEAHLRARGYVEE